MNDHSSAMLPVDGESPVASVDSSLTLRRELTLLDAVMINIGSMLGSGIFLVPAVVAAALPDVDWIIGVWVVGGVVSLAGAMSIAELGASMPKAGGLYEYLSATIHPLAGFLYGWSSFTIINSGSIAAVAVGSATYAAYFLPLSPLGIKLVAASTIVALTFVHVFGIRRGALIQNWLTGTKLAIVLVFVAAGLFFASTGDGPPPSEPTDFVFPSVLVPFGAALIAVLWAYDGWIELTMVGSEIKYPQRSIPRALILSTVVMIGIYVLMTVAFHSLLSIPEMLASSFVASDAAQRIMGPAGAAAISAAVLVSTLGTNNGFVFTIARIYYAMAVEGRFFAVLAKVHPVHRTPVNALIGQAVWSILLVFTGSFAQLTAYVVFASWIFYSLACIGVIKSRRKHPTADRPFHVPFYPIIPLLFIVCSLYVAGSAVAQSPIDAVIGLILILSGIPAYYYWMKKSPPAGR